MKATKNKPMFCPYVVHRSEVCEHTVDISPTATGGQQQVFTQVFNNHATMAACKRDLCGAYHNGRCHYGRG